MTVRQILEEYRSGPISTLTTEGRIYSIDQALSAIAEIIEGRKKSLGEHSGFWLTKKDVGYNQAITDICTLIRGQK